VTLDRYPWLTRKPTTPRIPRPFYQYKEKRRPLKDYTGAFLKMLRRPIVEGLIDFLSIVVIGTMGYGKSKLVEWVAAQVIEHYGEDQVNAIRNRGADLKALMENMDPRPVQLLFLDDSYGEMKADIAKEFTLIRHVHGDIREAAGESRSGVIIAIFGIQDLFTLDKLARRVGTCIIAKSSSSDKYYRGELKKNFGAQGLDELDHITKKVLHEFDQEAKSRSIITITGFEETGYLETCLVDVDPFIDVERCEQVEAVSPRVIEEKIDEGLVEWERETIIQDPSFLKLVYDMVPEALKDVSTRKYQPHHSEAWMRYYYEGSTQDHLASEYARTKAVFSNDYDNGGWFAIFSKEVMGYAAEIALQRRFFQSLEVWGKNNPEAPDLYNPDSGEMVEVKMRKRRKPPSLDMFSGSEIQAIKQGTPVKLALITYDKKKCTIEVWRPRALPNPHPQTEPKPQPSNPQPPPT